MVIINRNIDKQWAVVMVLTIFIMLCLALPVQASIYTYDESNRLQSITYDTGKKVLYNYDVVGNLLSVSIPPFDGATILSDDIPSTMNTGWSYTVQITVQNTGTTTWTETNWYRLGAVGDSDPFAAGRQYLNPGENIGPGQQKTFTFTMTAPTTPGTYTTDWRMVREGVTWFGSTLVKTVTVNSVPPYDAALIRDDIPTTMELGQSYTANVTVKNTGSNTWTEAEWYRLGAVGDSDPFAAGRQSLNPGESIGPGQQKTFTFTMTAPTTPGTYITDWQMVRDAVTWFGQTLTKTVTVSNPPPYSAAIISDDIPTTMVAGQSYTVNITVKNTGSNTWTETDWYRLGAVGDSDPFAAGRQYLNPGESIGPGQQKTFTFTMTAPTTPGTYITDWQMVRDAVTWFGGTLSKQVNVL